MKSGKNEQLLAKLNKEIKIKKEEVEEGRQRLKTQIVGPVRWLMPDNLRGIPGSHSRRKTDS